MPAARQKTQTILLNAARLAETLLRQMPSDELSEQDKAFFAHMLGIHAVLYRLQRPTTWLAARMGVLGDQPKDLLWLLGVGCWDDLRYVLDNGTSDSKEFRTLASQVCELYAGGIRFDRPEIIRPFRLKLYSYVLFRIPAKGFQQYARHLHAIIPQYLNPDIAALEQALQDTATRDAFLRQIKSSER